MFLIYDTESTDMLNFKLDADHPNQARIVQIGAVLTDADLVPVRSMCRIIRPAGWTIQPGAQKAHGISLARCHDEGVAIAEAMAEFDAMWAECVTIAAFNIRWDNKFIRGERRRLGLPDGFGQKREFDVMKASSPICALPPTPAMVRAGRGKSFKTPKLIEAHTALCGAGFDDAHDALADAMATLAVLKVLRDKHGVDIAGEFPESYAAKGARPEPAPARKPSLTPHVPMAATDDFFNG
jgi:exonuclease I